MDWLKSIAPVLGTALAGPLGGAAASYMADKLGVPERTVTAVTAALLPDAITPEQITQIKDAEREFEKFLKAHQIDLAKLDADNTRDARAMQTATRAMTPAVLTYLITVGFFGVLAYLMISGKPSNEPLLIMLGSLGTAWTAAVSFSFGSTHGSQTKTNLLARST